MRLNAFRARAAILVGIAAVYLATFLIMDGLRFEPRLDEEHFWKTTEEHFVVSFPPSVDSLRSYPEIITPVSYIIWGQLHRLTSDGIFAGRILNFLLSVAMISLLAFSRRPTSLAGPHRNQNRVPRRSLPLGGNDETGYRRKFWASAESPRRL